MAAETIDRRVQFFRLDILPNEDGQVPQLTVATIFKRLNALPFMQASTGPDSRYWDQGHSVLAGWPSSTAPWQLRLGKIRRKDLPGVEDGGAVSSLDIAKTAGVVDTTHIQFFDNGIVGAEYNHYGPRATILSQYCQEKLLKIPHFRLRPIIHRNAAEQFDEIEDVRVVSLRVHPSQAQTLEQISTSLPDALKALSSEYGADSVELVIRAPRSRSLKSRFKATLKGMLRDTSRAVDGPVSVFDEFKIRGRSTDTERVEMFDLLTDRFVVEKPVRTMQDRTRRVNSESMFSAIAAAYNSLKNEL